MRSRAGEARGAGPLTVVACAGALVLVVLAVFAPILLHSAANKVDVAAARQTGSAAHLLGTDALGRDILARTLVATRQSVALALGATAIGSVAGTVLGAVPVLLGRRAGRWWVGALNVLVAFPGLLLALFLAVIFGLGATGAMFALGLAMAPGLARLTYTMSSSVASSDYVAAARMLGTPLPSILVRHLLPNIAEPLLVGMTAAIGSALLAFSGLSFLGLGVQPPSYDWGRLLNDGLGTLYENPAAALGPGVAVVLAGMTFSVVGEAAAARAAGRRGPVPMPVPASSRDQRRESLGGAASTGTEHRPVLRLAGLHISVPTGEGRAEVVSGVSFDVSAGEAVGIVGESGSGKSLTALAAVGLTPDVAQVEADAVELVGVDVLHTPARQVRHRLGTAVATVFQDPMTSLNPSLRVGSQVGEVARVHLRRSRTQAWADAVDMLTKVRIGRPARTAAHRPHQLSGGMRQRAMIAMGLVGKPELIVADEPTTALDTTVQRQVLELISTARREQNTAVLFISHDIAVVASMCDRVLVMYAGRIVESMPTARLRAAAHPYTQALIASVPDLSTERGAPLATIPGTPPTPGARPTGCPFAPRCARADDECARMPGLVEVAPEHRVACWHPSIEIVAVAGAARG